MEETKKAKKKIQVFPIVNAIIMILLVIITLYPVLNTLAISLNDGTSETPRCSNMTSKPRFL